MRKYRVLVDLGQETVIVRAPDPKTAERMARNKVAETLREDVEADTVPLWNVIDVRPWAPVGTDQRRGA